LKKLCEFSTVWADWADWADLGSTETVLQTDSNFPSKGQFCISIFNNIPKLEKVGVTPFKTKKEIGPLYNKHTQLNVCGKEDLPCFLYSIQIFGFYFTMEK
jgi:hypothetical protein